MDDRNQDDNAPSRASPAEHLSSMRTTSEPYISDDSFMDLLESMPTAADIDLDAFGPGYLDASSESMVLEPGSTNGLTPPLTAVRRLPASFAPYIPTTKNTTSSSNLAENQGKTRPRSRTIQLPVTPPNNIQFDSAIDGLFLPEYSSLSHNIFTGSCNRRYRTTSSHTSYVTSTVPYQHPYRQPQQQIGFITCKECGKKYKKETCMLRHQWEHHSEWRSVLDKNPTKHHAFQMMEAAQILYSMSLGGKGVEMEAVAESGSGSTDLTLFAVESSSYEGDCEL